MQAGPSENKQSTPNTTKSKKHTNEHTHTHKGRQDTGPISIWERTAGFKHRALIRDLCLADSHKATVALDSFNFLLAPFSNNPKRYHQATITPILSLSHAQVWFRLATHKKRVPSNKKTLSSHIPWPLLYREPMGSLWPSLWPHPSLAFVPRPRAGDGAPPILGPPGVALVRPLENMRNIPFDQFLLKQGKINHIIKQMEVILMVLNLTFWNCFKSTCSRWGAA